MLPPKPGLLPCRFGTVADLNIWVVAQPAGTETLNAVDGVTGDPVGGACWEYHTGDNSGSPETLAIGPVCDTDNDGSVTVPDITYDAYCLFVTPPAGYTVVGNAPVCEPTKVRNGTYTKAMVSQSQGAGGSLHVSASAPWGAAQADICFKLGAPVGGNPADFSTACTDTTGTSTITGLLPGAYTLTTTGVPAAFQSFADQSITIVAGQTTEVAIPLLIRSSGDLVITSVLYYGPDKLPGACYSYVVNDNGRPGSVIVLGPVCDTDDDGITTIANVPAGSFCVTVASPPPGFYRQNNDGYSCDENMRGASGTVGFSPIPATATTAASPTRTNTPRPTATPYPTATRIPSPPPAGSEPNAGLLIKNCGYNESGDDPYFTECAAGPAGVRFQVLQNGAVVQTITSGSGGALTLSLPNRAPYTLHYIDGNGTWVSGPEEEARSRYDSSDNFYFQLNPATPHLWTLTVNIKAAPDDNTAHPIGGACAKIVGADGQTYVTERCDTDNDGTIDFGQLPARYQYLGSAFYTAIMTQAPAGLPIRTDTGLGLIGGIPSTTWTTGWSYLGAHQVVVRTEDGAGNLVPGYCYRFTYTTPAGTMNNDYVSDYLGLTNNTTYSSVPVGTLETITPRCTVPGYDLPTTSQTIAISASYQTFITFIAHKVGTNEADQASVRITAINPNYEFATSVIHAGFSDANGSVLCLTLTPNPGSPTTGCFSDRRTRQTLFRNLPAGTYTIAESTNTTGCTAKYPVTTFTIGASDLGAEKQVRYIMNCPSDNDNCTSFVNQPGRTVNIFYGTLYDAQGNPIASKTVLSESVTQSFYEQLFYQPMADPTFVNPSTLRPWVIPFSANSSSTPWDLLPDYDNNAQQILTNTWLGTGNAVVDAPVDRGTMQANSSLQLYFYFGPFSTEQKAQFPECANVSNNGTIFGHMLYQSTVHFYRLDAHIVPPAATATATTTPVPTATTIPSPDAACTTTVSRDLTAWYGVLKNDKGKTIATNLSLSDHIPAALSDAISHATSPGKVKSLISHWIDTGLVDADWAGSAGDSLDPAADLQQQYNTQATAVTLGTPTDLGATTYTFTTYVLRDERNLPAGCVSPAEYTDASLGRLIPVLQTTTVRIHYMGQDAVAQGQILPTATTTPSPEPTRTTTSTPEPTVPATTDPTATSVPDATSVAMTATITATATTTAPATRTNATEAATVHPIESPTAAVTSLPNTGAHPTDPGSRAYWLLIALLAVLSFCLTRVVIVIRRPV